MNDAVVDSFDHHLDTIASNASRWGEVQRHLLGQTFATVQNLQQRSLEESDVNTTNPTNSILELAASKAMTLIHQYVDDVRHAVDLPGSNERMAQARVLMRQYRVIETEYIIRLQSSMVEAYKKIRPDESISVSTNLQYLDVYVGFQQVLALRTTHWLTHMTRLRPTILPKSKMRCAPCKSAISRCLMPRSV